MLTVEEREGRPEHHQHVLQEGRWAGELGYAAPEPHHDGHDGREEDGLKGHPHLGEAAVLVDELK